MERKEKQLTLRMSPELHEQIRDSAARNKRSINAHALWILQSYVSAENTTDPEKSN